MYTTQRDPSGELADGDERDEGCWLQLGRLKMLSKKNFCAAQGSPDLGV